ncbi:MAG TPA: pyridoxamine 5-phosphate oxidase [Deltaproteobacteria bacterium]|nr:pyridoxamine 5'-phosphate oxidase family protein [Pseudomonadota bacterium]RZO45232.1 MAG: pyridoxamine 5'-phosphate oxidase family protein [Pseudomonadota bacterium]HBM52795.1 pyridoxamine 5-phosphate oxidase [Deltaproteobacteria bacterium]
MITEQHLPALQGLIPACVTTCSAAGEPNTTVISQVWYVDEDHVALSHQFFNKTRRNIAENPHAVVMILSPENGATFDLSITYARTETEGPLFDEMDMKLEAIASMTGMSGIFKLLGADIYKVDSIEQIV